MGHWRPSPWLASAALHFCGADSSKVLLGSAGAADKRMPPGFDDDLVGEACFRVAEHNPTT